MSANNSASSIYLLDTVVDSLYSTFLSSLDNLSSIFYNLLISLSIPADAIDYTIIGLTGFDLLLCLVGGYFMIKLISAYEDRVLHIFLEVPRRVVLCLNNQCETYVADLQNAENGNKAEVMSEEDEKETQEHHGVNPVLDRGGYERVYTHRRRLGISYLVSFIVLMLLAETYFVVEFVLRSDFYNSLNQFSTIYLTTYQEAVVYLEVIDVYREYFADPSTNIGRITPLPSIAYNYWTHLYETEKAYNEVFILLR